MDDECHCTDVNELQDNGCHHFERADCADGVQECWPHWQPADVYHYRVRAVNSAGKGHLVGRSNGNNRNEPAEQPPRAPRAHPTAPTDLRRGRWAESPLVGPRPRRPGYIHRSSATSFSTGRNRKPITDKSPAHDDALTAWARRDHCLPEPAAGHYLQPQRLAWRCNAKVRIPRARRQRHRRRRLVLVVPQSRFC